ncbi:helix-turn-helix domain-containing protein [Streptomyces marispadix]|uniref:Helix-turn-helix transcriptional regulator n=1 Tax=Streptomyces marispadix TaxID=2922868 RepID=A0ABS9T3A7_9ACTN|nr:helix-turn-helix transcriptional regulator [Streptomyces marispadix]MCH6162997.1 helix-turn-helix transcriptional regulator [Streptomyces marispadix]
MISEGDHEAKSAQHEGSWTIAADSGDPLLKAVGTQIKYLRDKAGLTQAEFGGQIGYGVDQVSSVERGRRPPKPQFITGAERVLDAGGMLAAIEDIVDQARLPARFRDFAKWERDAESFHSYSPFRVPGLLQTKPYIEALMSQNCPPLNDGTVEDRVAARLERQEIFDRSPAVVLGFVIEEAALRRPVGGPSVMKEQLNLLLERSALRHVSIQVMPMERWQFSPLGPLVLLETRDGRSLAYSETQGMSSFITDREPLQTCIQRHGIIRMQALDTEQSARFIEQLAGEL